MMKKRLQLIFCVETNQKSDTDFIYIKNAVDRFYDYKNGNIQLTPVYLGGKGKYSSSGITRQINKKINQFKAASSHGESYVFFCFDCDRYDSNSADQQFLLDAEKYCLSNPIYHFVWFCRDIEDVFLGHQINNNLKVTEAERFAAKKLIEQVHIDRLTAKQYKLHHSNICLVLNRYLPRKK